MSRMPGMAAATLVSYDDSMLAEMAEVMLQDSLPLRSMDESLRSEVMAKSLREHRGILRVIRDAGDGTLLGYCDVRDVRKDDWELGIALLRHARLTVPSRPMLC